MRISVKQPKGFSDFMRQWLEPFVILLLIGFVVYLASIVGGSDKEKRDIQAIAAASKPSGVFFLPDTVLDAGWPSLRFGFGKASVRFPLNWRMENQRGSTIIREGEGAIVVFSSEDSIESGDSMLAYRVARISALQELKYHMDSIEEASLGGDRALVFRYHDGDEKNDIYEATLLNGSQFYTATLLMKKERASADMPAIINEYKSMLATLNVE